MCWISSSQLHFIWMKLSLYQQQYMQHWYSEAHTEHSLYSSGCAVPKSNNVSRQMPLICVALVNPVHDNESMVTCLLFCWCFFNCSWGLKLLIISVLYLFSKSQTEVDGGDVAHRVWRLRAGTWHKWENEEGGSSESSWLTAKPTERLTSIWV